MQREQILVGPIYVKVLCLVIANVNVFLGELDVERELLGRVKSLKLGYYWRVTRKYESLEKELIQGCAPGNRSRGRQRRRWTDDIIEWTGLTITEAARSTEDRDRWREILRAANPSSGGRHWTTTTTTNVNVTKYTMSQKTVKIVFARTLSNFHQLW